MKKLLGIVVLGLLFCNVGFAKEIILACEGKTYKDHDGVKNDWAKGSSVVIINPSKKIWKWRNGSEDRLIVTDTFYATYYLNDDIGVRYGGKSYYTILYTMINRYDGGYYDVQVDVIDHEFEKFNKKYKKSNYNTFFEEVRDFTRKQMRNNRFHVFTATCKESSKKL